MRRIAPVGAAHADSRAWRSGYLHCDVMLSLFARAGEFSHSSILGACRGAWEKSRLAAVRVADLSAFASRCCLSSILTGGNDDRDWLDVHPWLIDGVVIRMSISALRAGMGWRGVPYRVFELSLWG